MTLALDLSTKSSGYAIFNESIKLIDYGEIKASSTNLIPRIETMQKGILKILNQYPNINKVVLEEVHPDVDMKNVKTHKALMWAQGAVVMTIYNFNNNIQIDYIYPSSWRSILGIKNGRNVKRAEAKKMDIQYVKDNFNLSCEEDACDAICIGYAYLQKNENEINWE